MESIAEALLGMVAMLGVFGSPVVAIAVVLRHRRQMKVLEIQHVEAQTKLARAQALGELPEYIDSEDPRAVAAYRHAVEETLRSSARHAAAAQANKQR